jgi:hypothetical protein
MERQQKKKRQESREKGSKIIMGKILTAEDDAGGD